MSESVEANAFADRQRLVVGGTNRMMSLSLLRFTSRRCLSVFKTKVPSPPPTKTSNANETVVKVYDKLEDVDQKKVTLPVNRDLYPADTATHTGQAYDHNDYRNIRFVNKGKLVNPRFAINYVRDDPVVVVKGRGVWSDSGGPLGHPKVYINLDKPGIHSCGYSGRKFIQKKFYNEGEHGPSISYEEYVSQLRNRERDAYDAAQATPFQ